MAASPMLTARLAEHAPEAEGAGRRHEACSTRAGPTTKQPRRPTLVGRPLACAAAANTSTWVGVSAPTPCSRPTPNDDQLL